MANSFTELLEEFNISDAAFIKTMQCHINVLDALDKTLEALVGEMKQLEDRGLTVEEKRKIREWLTYIIGIHTKRRIDLIICRLNNF